MPSVVAAVILRVRPFMETDRSLIDEELKVWEALIEERSLWAGRPDGDGITTLRRESSPAEQVAGDTLKERWVQR